MKKRLISILLATGMVFVVILKYLRRQMITIHLRLQHQKLLRTLRR